MRASEVGILRVADIYHQLAALAAAFLLAWALLTAVFYSVTRGEVLDDAYQRIEGALSYHRALHSYVLEEMVPEIQRLKREGGLYQDYFSPELLSFAYITRKVQQAVSLERQRAGLPAVHFKLAAINPRNPINRADAFEERLLRHMNETGTDRVQREIERGDGHFLYVAASTHASGEACMGCHGDPADAPAELLTQYGDKEGFFEQPGDIRAILSLSAPIGTALERVKRITLLFATATFVALAGIYGFIAILLYRLSRERRQTQEHNARLYGLVREDKLTGLANRQRLEEHANLQLAQARRYGTPLALLMIDLDHFKTVNDSHGHLEGDRVLRAFADFLRKHTRAADLCARWGGEEFVILAAGIDGGEALRLADSLRLRLRGATLGNGVKLSLSCGVAVFREDDDLDRLISRADAALYRAKRNGRDRVEVAADGGMVPAMAGTADIE